MRRFFCILICLSMASMVSALSITNGNFGALGVRNDVPDWFEEADTYLRLKYSLNETQYMGFRDDDCWAYQSIGFNTGSVPAIQVQYDIGSVLGSDTESTAPRDLFLTVSLYESDGSFIGEDGRNIADDDYEDSVTLIDSVTVSYPAMVPGQDVVTDSVTLNYLNLAGSGELFLRFKNKGDDDDDTNDRCSIDNVQLNTLPSVVSPIPKDGAAFVAIERASAENDLVFYVADPAITEVDVLFDTDPNLPLPASKIVEGRSVSQGQNTITLETELTEDLDFSTEYTWQVLAYEPNGLETTLKYTSPKWDFETIQEGPLLEDVDPGKQFVYPGEDAVFSVDHIKADTFQWRWAATESDPNVPLSNGADYAGVDTDTLTVLDAQLADEGVYYCVGTETASGKSHISPAPGELRIKQLMAHYPFETSEGGFTPDIIGGKDMQLMGGASLDDANSIVGKNLLLVNPGNQYARIIDNTVADYEDCSITFWCLGTTLDDAVDGDRWARVFDFGKDATEYIMFTMLYRQDDDRQGGLDVARCEMRYFDDEGSEQNPELDAESEIEPGKWYHVAITIKANENEDDQGASGRIYINGEHGTERENPQRLGLPRMTEITKTLHYLGKGIGFDPPYFNGRIDEFKIYNYPLTSAEVSLEYFEVTGAEFICDKENYDLYDWDYNGNCVIDLPDFAEIASHWMEGYLIYAD